MELASLHIGGAWIRIFILYPGDLGLGLSQSQEEVLALFSIQIKGIVSQIMPRP